MHKNCNYVVTNETLWEFRVKTRIRRQNTNGFDKNVFIEQSGVLPLIPDVATRLYFRLLFILGDNELTDQPPKSKNRPYNPNDIKSTIYVFLFDTYLCGLDTPFFFLISVGKYQLFYFPIRGMSFLVRLTIRI
jgi:hypothetical protein